MTAGTKLGSYDVLAPIGKGGMGEVWKARDTKLGRDVALKILPAAFASDPDRMARFEREARVLASLDHPNIAAIYGLEESDGIRALVLALINGPTLAERIAAGPIPLDEAIQIARQIAEAVEYAHDHGVIHRDLKPANIKITSGGMVKVLDFGLAKALDDEPVPGSGTNSPTLTMGATRAGILLGTAAYMSPEQAKGKQADRRSDIWSFGAVLYEMLTGKPPFSGESVGEVIAAVIKDEPKLDEVPAELRNLVGRCLNKDPRKRLQAIGEARIALEDPAPPVHNAAATVQKNRMLPWITAAANLAFIALAVISYRHLREDPPRVLKLSVLPPEKATFNGRSLPAVSPDGRRLVVAAMSDGKDQLWVRDLDSLAARALPGTEGADDPFWSPDSRFIAFFADRKLKKIDVTGGPALTLCDAGAQGSARGGTWGKNYVIVFAETPSGLYRVPAAGGNATPITTKAERFPWFLPDGRHFLYAAGRGDGTAGIFVADLDSNERELVLVAGSNAVYSSPGYLLFLRESTLMAQPFDARSGKAAGEAVPIAEQVDSIRSNLQGNFSASLSPDKGVVVYTSGIAPHDQLTWFDRSGKALGTNGGPGIGNPAISPDGNTIMGQRGDTRTGVVDLWLLAGSAESRFTLDRPRNRFPVWSPDGNYIAFDSPRKLGTPDIFVKAVRASTGHDSSDVALETPGGNLTRGVPDDWTPDGRYIVAEFDGPKTKRELWELPWSPEAAGVKRAPIPYLQAAFNEQDARVSPNGRWLAYASDESSRFEIYVQTFPTAGGKSQVSTHGGTLPVWSKDGKELFFIGADRKMTAVEVKGAALNDQAAFQVSEPKILFDASFLGFGRFGVSNDGRFLIPAPSEQSANVPITVVINWQAALNK